jgi:hypothetical protein
MADDGLFSNLKFTDILFPAAGAIASAYNPHIGRGLQSGMNLFNTMASFQGDIRKWKVLEEERKRELAALEQAQGAAGEYLGGLEGRAADIKRRYTDMFKEEMDFPQGPGGAALASVEEPMSEEDFQKAMEASIDPAAGPGIFGRQNIMGVSPEGQAELAGDPVASFQAQMAASAPPPMSEAIPGLLDERVSEALSLDPQYDAVQREIALAKLMGGTMAAGPGSSIATLGHSALGSQDLAQETQRMLDAIGAQDEYAKNRFIENQYLKAMETEEVGKRAEHYAQGKAQQYDAWVKASETLRGLTDDNIGNAKFGELLRAKNQAWQLLQRADSYGVTDPLMLADLYSTVELVNAELEKRGFKGGYGAGYPPAGGRDPSDPINPVLNRFRGGSQ